MHGQTETSNAPRLTCYLIHLLFLALVAWIYFGGGSEVITGWLGLGGRGQGNSVRRLALFGFSLVLFLRLGLTEFYLLRRKFGWSELGGVVMALFCYQVVFALLGAGEARPLGVVDLVAIAIFLVGSGLNTGSELQRKKFKDKPENQGVLYTRGLFKYARHINYFGDALWVIGWAMLTRNVWSFIIPLCLVAMFIFMFIPSLSKYLRGRYGEQYEIWAHKTKAFIPYIY